MPALALEFDAEVVDEERLLNGARRLVVEGEGQGEDGSSWTLTLSVERPKETDAPIAEADLTLTGPDLTLIAAIESGRATLEFDAEAGDERDSLQLVFRVIGGMDGSEPQTGRIELQAELAGTQARLSASVVLAD